MEKSRINRFVSKYNFTGLVESVKWESKDGSLSTSFISDDKSVLGTVTFQILDLMIQHLVYMIQQNLTKMLGVLSDDIDFDITKIDGKSVSLKFKDGSTSVNYMLPDLSVIPSVPDLKQLPDFNITIKLDDVFINRFIKSKGASLPDENNFTFTCKDNSGKIILGHSNINTNRIKIDVDCVVMVM